MLRGHLRNYFATYHPQARIKKRNILAAFLLKIKEVYDKKLFVLCQVKEDFELLQEIV